MEGDQGNWNFLIKDIIKMTKLSQLYIYNMKSKYYYSFKQTIETDIAVKSHH